MNSHALTVSRVLNIENSRFFRVMGPILDRLTGIKKISDLYRKELAGLSEEEFLERAIQVFGIRFQLSEEESLRIPRQGPVIVIANHPYGAHDAALMAWLLNRFRKDYKILANNFVTFFEEMKERLIPVNAFRSGPWNRQGVSEAVRHLRDGGILGIFPAGSVSHFRFRKRSVTDSEWPETVARFVRLTGASVVPVHFSGRNSLAFQIGGLIHPLIRTAMLPREMLQKKRLIQVHIGTPVQASYLTKMQNSSMTDYLRMRCYLLQEMRNSRDPKVPSVRYRWIISAVQENRLERDIKTLPEENSLLRQGKFDVYWARAEDIPSVLVEIGRLREITFREEGEGTGKSVDLDRYDETYLHLFVWNREKREIIGAYRMGQVDVLTDRFGRKGLYTAEFYKYTNKFLKEHHFALEMGRSFVRKEYQKKPFSLMLLWKGICAFVNRYPQYRFLFGAVSVSNAYDSRSRVLIASMLKEQAKALKSKMPVKIRMNKEVKDFCRRHNMESLNDLSVLVKSIEKDGKDIPMLVRQYMRLGGRFFSFCVDKGFNSSLDGLIVVDLPNAPQSVLKMYMGNGMESYLDYHQKASPDFSQVAG